MNRKKATEIQWLSTYMVLGALSKSAIGGGEQRSIDYYGGVGVP